LNSDLCKRELCERDNSGRDTSGCNEIAISANRTERKKEIARHNEQFHCDRMIRTMGFAFILFGTTHLVLSVYPNDVTKPFLIILCLVAVLFAALTGTGIHKPCNCGRQPRPIRKLSLDRLTKRKLIVRLLVIVVATPVFYCGYFYFLTSGIVPFMLAFQIQSLLQAIVCTAMGIGAIVLSKTSFFQQRTRLRLIPLYADLKVEDLIDKSDKELNWLIEKSLECRQFENADLISRFVLKKAECLQLPGSQEADEKQGAA